MSSVRPKLVEYRHKVSDAEVEAVFVALHAEETARNEVQQGKKNRSPMFEFAKSLRDSPSFSGLGSMEALDLVQSALAEKGTSLTRLPYEDPAMSFLAIWPVVMMRGTFDRAVRSSRENPVPMKDSPSPEFAAFCSLCSHLSVLCGDAPILVPCTTFAKTLNLAERTISSYRKVAMRLGLLQMVELGTWKEGRRVADKFRWIGPLPPSRYLF